MGNQQMREMAPIVLWEESHEVELNLHWIIVPRERHSTRQAHHMRVDHDANIDPEGIAEHHIGGLSCHTPKGQKLIHCCRDFALKIADDGGHRLLHRTGLVSPEVEGLKRRRDFIDGAGSECLGRWERGEEGRRCLVDANIRGLRRENCGDQEFMWLRPVQRAGCVWISPTKRREESGGARALHWSLSSRGRQQRNDNLPRVLPQITTQLPPLAATIAPLAGEAIEALEAISNMGYRAAQLSATQVGTRPRDLDISGRKDLVVRLRRFGLTCAGLDLWIPPAHYTESAFVDRAVDAVSQAVTLAAALGRCPVSIALPEQTEKNKSRLQEVREAIGACAEREGVWIADHGLDAALGRWSPPSSAALGVGIDPPTLLAGGHDVTATIALARNNVVSARVVDLLQSGMRGPVHEPHDARLDLDSYAVALAAIPLRYAPVADARQWIDPRAGLQATLRHWRGESS